MKYRIKQTQQNWFVIEAWTWLWPFWTDISTPTFPTPPGMWKPLTTVEKAKERLEQIKERRDFKPVVVKESR